MRNTFFAAIGFVFVATSVFAASTTPIPSATKRNCELIWGSCTMQCVSADVTDPNSMLLCNIVCVDGEKQQNVGPLAPEGHE